MLSRAAAPRIAFQRQEGPANPSGPATKQLRTPMFGFIPEGGALRKSVDVRHRRGRPSLSRMLPCA